MPHLGRSGNLSLSPYQITSVLASTSTTTPHFVTILDILHADSAWNMSWVLASTRVAPEQSTDNGLTCPTSDLTSWLTVIFVNSTTRIQQELCNPKSLNHI